MLRNKYFPIANNRERPSPESRVQTWSIINEPQLIIHRGRPPESVRWHPRGTTHRDTGHIGPGQRSDDAWNSSWWTQFPDRFFCELFLFLLFFPPCKSTCLVHAASSHPRGRILRFISAPQTSSSFSSSTSPRNGWRPHRCGGFNFGNPVRRSLILHTGETVHDDGAFFPPPLLIPDCSRKKSHLAGLSRITDTHTKMKWPEVAKIHTRHVTTMVYCGNNFSLSSISYNSLIFLGEASDFRPRHRHSDLFLLCQRILWKVF